MEYANYKDEMRKLIEKNVSAGSRAGTQFNTIKEDDGVIPKGWLND